MNVIVVYGNSFHHSADYYWRSTRQCVGPTSVRFLHGKYIQLTEMTLTTFSDDTRFLSSSDSYHTAVWGLQQFLETFYSWSTRRKILIIGEKSVNVTFTLHPHPHSPVVINGIIPSRLSINYLGINFDERCNLRFVFLLNVKN